jgi:dTMP kinase
MAPWLREPDLTLYLQIDPEEAIERASEDEKYESLDILVSVEENYRALAQTQDRIETIDASMSKEAVLKEARSVVRRQ